VNVSLIIISEAKAKESGEIAESIFFPIEAWRDTT
jgi:hypothetical protein